MVLCEWYAYGKGDKTESIDGAQVDEEDEGLPGGDAVVLERRDEGGGAAGPELVEKETISVCVTWRTIWLLESHRPANARIRVGVSPSAPVLYFLSLAFSPASSDPGSAAPTPRPALIEQRRPAPGPSRERPTHSRGVRLVPGPELRGAPRRDLGLAADACVDQRRRRRSRICVQHTEREYCLPAVSGAAVHARGAGTGVDRGMSLHPPLCSVSALRPFNVRI
ncbi:uncharacterized protein PG998_010660 [Apiospora kogelbergensis]|uniref:uncharacterized protein n=1 Tax=Apiospora kogelbergensis TaxID=1337665 RepID=UPI00312D0AF9